MLDNLRKKKLLEQLGVNKKVDTKTTNHQDQSKDVVKKATDTMKSMGVQSMNPGKFHNQSMQKVPLKEQIEEGKEKDTIGFQKTHSTLGIDTTSEKEEKKKKALESLFTKRK